MKTGNTVKGTLKIALLVTTGVAVSGCFGPTYGTGVTAGDQLVADLGGALSLAPEKKAPINYVPRPDIVTPADANQLPAPQEKIADTSPEWPESTEQKRQRILASIEAGNRPDNFVTNKKQAAELGASEGPGRGTTAGKRIYLTDPPGEYRQPAQTAAVGELGVSEAKKERIRKRARKKSDGGWRRFVPWL